MAQEISHLGPEFEAPEPMTLQCRRSCNPSAPPAKGKA